MANVKNITSSVEFVDALAKSRLLTTEQIDRVKTLAATQTDATVIARQLIKEKWLTKWQAGQLLSGFTSLVYSKYRLCDQRSRDAVSRVYLVEHEADRRQLLLRIPLSKYMQRKEFSESFTTESRRIQGITSNHVVVVDEVADGDRCSIATVVPTGVDLESHVSQKGPMPAEQVRQVLSELADAIQSIHDAGVVHFDVRPGNVYWDEKSGAKLMFIPCGRECVSAAIAEDAAAKDGGLRPSDFISPEFATAVADKSANVDFRTDYYSLGTTAFYLITGRLPFSAGTPDERRQRRVTTDVLYLVDIRPETPADLADLVVRLCHRDPSLRPANANEIKSMLALPKVEEELVSSLEPTDLDVASIEVLAVTSDNEQPITSAEELRETKEAIAHEPKIPAANEPSATVDQTVSSPSSPVDEVVLAENSAQVDTTADADDLKLEPLEERNAAPIVANVELASSVSSAAESPPATPQSDEPTELKTLSTESASDTGETAPTIQLVVPALRTGKRKKKKAGTTSDDDLATAGIRKRQRTRMWIAVGSAIGLVLTITIGFVISKLNSWRSQREVAQATDEGESQPAADKVADKAQDAVSADGPISDVPPELVAEPDVKPSAGNPAPSANQPNNLLATASPAPNQPAVGAQPGGSPLANPAVPAPVSGAPATGAPATGTPMPNPSVPPAGTLEPANPTSPTPASPTPTSSVPASQPQPNPPPPSPTAPAPAPTDTPKQPMDVAKVEPKAEPPKPMAKPFKSFPEVVDLPAIGTTDPVVLGVIEVGDKDCYLSLKGADTATKGKSKLSIQNAQGGTAAREWEVSFGSGNTSDVVATFAIKDQNLVFQWTEKSSTASMVAAGNLRNLILNMTAGPEIHQTRLRTPMKVKPAVVQIEKGETKERWAVDALPPTDRVKLEITSIGGGRKVFTEPNGPIDLSKGNQLIWVAEKADEAVFGFALHSTVAGKNLQMSFSPQFKFVAPAPITYNKINVKKMEGTLAGLPNTRNLVEEFKKLPNEKKSTIQAEINNANVTLAQLELGAKQRERMKGIIDSLKDGCDIQFRLYFEVEDKKVTILETDPALR